MTRFSPLATVAILSLSAGALNFQTGLLDDPVARASIVLIAGTFLSSVVAILGQNTRRKQQLRARQNRTVSPAHIKGWQTRRTNESRQRQYSLALMQNHLAGRDTHSSRPTRH